MSIFNHHFTNSEIVAATGVTNFQLQNWLKRGQVVGQVAEGGGSPGKHRKFSFFNLMQIAVAKAMIDVGMTDMKRVTYEAAGFAHAGDFADDRRPARWPGLPFKNGRTFLIIGPARSEEYQVLSSEKLGFISAILRHGNGAVVINVSQVFEDVMRRAGFDPAAILREAYKD